jgi:SAM-dependent methyltransferase
MACLHLSHLAQVETRFLQRHSHRGHSLVASRLISFGGYLIGEERVELHFMPATDRLQTERLFHDDQARQRTATFELRPDELRFDDDSYLDHETWIRPAFARLGDVRGLRALDFGCGHAMAAVVLARRGAEVTAFDLSCGYLAEARRRAESNRVAIRFVQAEGARLPFADASFDRVWGNAILHHLDIKVAGRELRRILRPGGVAVFCEPWGGNPLLRFARRRMPYSGKGRTRHEEPLRPSHLRHLWQIFPHIEMRGFQLLSMTRRVLRPGRLLRWLEKSDSVLLARAPALQRYCRYAVLTLTA